MSTPIPLHIHSEELLVRGIVHPMFYSESKNRLKREAFLPPPTQQDVSLLRRRYSPHDTFCKMHCKSIRIGSNTYCGMATFLARHVNENYRENDSVSLSIKATPIDEQNQYVSEEVTVYMESPGLPMHADLLYNIPAPQRGQPSTLHRVIADRFLKNVCFFRDQHPESDNWDGPELTWTTV